ncbi:Fe2OG dioxygenase domain-containing protein [Fusarium sp. LHS14.1]|nr:Fe2OG dioxygenase domain-containing protein [Fusarium sp. LHS14.1]
MTTYLNIRFAFTLSRRIRTSAHPLLSTAHMKFPLKDRTPFQIASQRMSTNAVKIPVIDISAPDVDQKDVARQLVDAAEEHGFIYIRNLGRDISAADVDGAFELVQKTFECPVEEKQRCTIQTNNRGWSGMHSETLDPKNQKIGDFKEAFNFGEFVNGKAQQPLPSDMVPHEPRISAFADSCHNLCQKLLYLLGLGLGVDDFFSSAHNTAKGASSSILRFLRYPPPDATAHSDSDVRAGAHSDYGSITLLFRLRGQAGLELLTKDDVWAPVPVCPPGTEDDPSPPVLINIGDLLSYWTNGLFRSTLHRVVFPTEGTVGVAGETSAGPRYSIAYFCHPVGTAPLEPVPSERVKDFKPSDGGAPSVNPYATSKVMTADEHLFMRLKESYGDLYDKKS